MPGLFSLESERAILCAALDESRANIVREIATQISANDFYEEAHQNIWNCWSSLMDAGVAHDVASIAASARRLAVFVGGPDYLLSLAKDEILRTSSDLALQAASRRIKDLSLTRYLTSTLQSTVSLAMSGQSSLEDLTTLVNDGLEFVRSAATLRSNGPVHIAHYVSAVTEQIDMRSSGQEPTNTVTSGNEELDRLILGLHEGDLIVVAARPSMGKTAKALSIAEAAAKTGRPVLIFSTEQSGNALTYRMLASEGRIEATQLKRGDLSQEDWSRLVDGARTLGELPIYIDDTSELTLPELRSKARQFALKHPRPLIVVDYMQRLAPHKQGEPRMIIGEISTGLKNLAKELKSPVVALAQLSRTVESRTNKRPMMSDLAESGKIEQDADMIFFLYRDDYYNPDSKHPGIAEVIVGKNRDGMIGVVREAFDKKTQRYTSIGGGY